MNAVYLRLMVILLVFTFDQLHAQTWEQNDLIFNPSGIPSLPFSQPRFADLDADGDFDMILGNLNDRPLYFRNVGSTTNPEFDEVGDFFSFMSASDAEVCIGVDLDGDGDLDLVAGGYTGLNMYVNTGDSVHPAFVQQNGFFSGLSAGSNPVPTFADVDNDNDYDLLIGLSESGLLKLYTNSGDSGTAVFLETNVATLGDVGLYAYPVFCDLDQDGDPDILTGRDGYNFYYYENKGTADIPDWQRNDALFSGLGSTTYWNSPDLVDLNGDGKFDLVHGTASGPLQYYRNSGTSSAPSWRPITSLFGGVLDVGGASSPFLIDFDYDGDLDLVSGTNLGSIKYYKNTGTPEGPAWTVWNSYFSSIDHSIYSRITLGDVNGDSLPDAVVGDLSGNLYFHRNTGSGFVFESSVLDEVSLGGWSAPTFADMDLDDDLDIVAGNESGNFVYLENSGTPDSASWAEVPGYFGTIDVGSNAVPALADMDHDGDADLISGDMWGEVQYFRNDEGSWEEDPSVVSGVSGGQNTAPAAGDLDGDGDFDLVLGNYDGTFNYFENKSPVSIRDDRYMEVPEDFVLDRVYPNPFNVYAVFRGRMAVPGLIALRIFSVRGRLVFGRDYECNAGEFGLKIMVNSNLASGLYFYRLTMISTTETIPVKGKLVLLK